MATLRRRTELVRATVDQSLRVLLHPDREAKGSWQTRRVSLIVPQAPRIYLALDVNPVDIGNQLYKLPVLTPGVLQFQLRSDQTMIGAAESGVADLAIAVEYLDHTEVD